MNEKMCVCSEYIRYYYPNCMFYFLDCFLNLLNYNRFIFVNLILIFTFFNDINTQLSINDR